ncbi:DUF2244 domain-containing protein [Gemmobacter aquatilis]|nr:DUF2244 domain-containing protein [Gemmobacter aquatilis]
MPYEWLPPSADGPTARLHLWPYRSLPRRGFVWFIGGTAVLIAVPLLSVLGSPVLWGLLPFLLATIGGIWWALERSYRDGEIVEDLALWPDRITLVRHGPHGRRQDWQANPYWVRVIRHEQGGPVPQYLTLKGGTREVEIGSFLAEEERVTLAAELTDRLTRLPPA